MGLRREIALKAFLNNCPAEKKDRLLSFLSANEQASLSKLPDIHLREEGSSNHLLEHIHWSWFVPLLETYPTKDQKFFLRAFPNLAQKSLSKTLRITPSTEKISRVGSTFLRQTLLHLIRNEDILPVDHLPPSPLNLLLQIEKKKLTQLIDYLSLYDLSQELRQIVETKILQKIYSFLTDDEKLFLKIAASQKEPYTAAQIHLDRWDGTKKSFRLTLHRIGLARLGWLYPDKIPI